MKVNFSLKISSNSRQLILLNARKLILLRICFFWLEPYEGRTWDLMPHPSEDLRPYEGNVLCEMGLMPEN